MEPGEGEGDALGRRSTLNQPCHAVPETRGQTLPPEDQMTYKALRLWLRIPEGLGL